MDEVKLKSKPVAKPLDRATLSAEVTKKLDDWSAQVSAVLSGVVSVNRSDLVNFIIESAPSKLSSEQISNIKAKHFDELKFAQWALKQIRESKSKGESMSLAGLVAGACGPALPGVPRARKQKVKEPKVSADDELAKISIEKA